jgi:hypothetical protein
MKDSDNTDNSLTVDTATTSEVVSALKEEADKTHESFKLALNDDDIDATDAAYVTYQNVDNKRLQFDRAVVAAKEVLDPSE